MALASCSDPQHCCPAVTSADPPRFYCPEEGGHASSRSSLWWEDLRRAMAWRSSKAAGGKSCLGRRAAASAAAATPAAASDNPPVPGLGHFIPASDQITSERQIHLTSNGPAQVVVQFQSAEPDAQGKTAVDLMILSWDHFAKRWVTVWDGAKVQSPDATSTSGGLAQDAVLPSAAFISDLTYRPITPSKGRTDLEFSDFYNFGANGSVEVGIVHYDGQSASMAYFDTVNPGSSRPRSPAKRHTKSSRCRLAG